MTQLLNIIVRGATLSLKFALIFFLARFLTPDEIGLYGLLVATISYALYLLGFDFYTFSTREILNRPVAEWGGVLKNQIALLVLSYLIFLPLLSVGFYWGLLPKSVAPWFFFLLVLEHINQEFGRLLITASKQLSAGIALFIRSAAWVLPVLLYMVIEPSERTLEVLLAGWASFSVIALFFSYYQLKPLGILGWGVPIDWRWIWMGVKVALPFLFATLTIRGIYTLDRFWIERLSSLEILGAYILFATICNALMSFLEAGFFSFAYPKLIMAYGKKDPKLFRKHLCVLFFQTLAIIVCFSLSTSLLMDYILNWVGRDVYIKYEGIYYWLLVSTSLYALSMVPHYGLYAQGIDRPIIVGQALGFFAFAASVFIISNISHIYAVPISLCVAFLFIALWKFLSFYMYGNHEYAFSAQSFRRVERMSSSNKGHNTNHE